MRWLIIEAYVYCLNLRKPWIVLRNVIATDKHFIWQNYTIARAKNTRGRTALCAYRSVSQAWLSATADGKSTSSRSANIPMLRR